MIGVNKKNRPSSAISFMIENNVTAYKDIDSIEPYLFDLGNQEWDTVDRFLEQKEPDQHRMYSTMQMFMRFQDLKTYIESLESDKQEELIKLGKQAMSQMYGIPEDQINWEIQITNAQEIVDELNIDKEKYKLDLSRIQYMKKCIKKRKILNALVHGSSMHVWKSCHYFIYEDLIKLNPTLPTLYDSYAAITGILVWQNPPFEMEDMSMAFAQGMNKLELDDDEEPKVKVKALNFPTVLHEMNKAVIDLIMCHGIPDDLTEDELRLLYKCSDSYYDEQWHFLIAPSIWERLLKYSQVETQNLPDVIMHLSKLSLFRLERVIESLCQNNEGTTELLKSFKLI